ncbi:hypothetical protein LIA77_11626 [Sarocladium implicatum]|nr:hypothetical protein LIA77_11626 [Sarocladium implicatum]
MANLTLSLRGLLSCLLISLLSLVALARYESPYAAYSARDRALSKDGSTGHSIHARALGWETARTKGHRLHCLMGMSRAEAQASNGGASFEAPQLLQNYGMEELEGWSIADSHTPLFKNYLEEAFKGIGAPAEVKHSEYWLHIKHYEVFPDPNNWGEGVPESGLITDAVFSNSFTPASGVIIADESRSVIAALKEKDPDTWPAYLLGPLTIVRQWSDAAWMQWVKACAFAEWEDTSNVRYMFQSWIGNKDTLSIVFQAMINKYGRGAMIHKWANRASFTLADEPDELFAILGTPNGVGQPYFLITHKDAIGIKTINKVEVFVPNIAYPVGTTVPDDALAAKIMLLFTVTKV